MGAKLPRSGFVQSARLRHGPPRSHATAWADVAVFDPARIRDRSTYEEPHQYAAGVSTVVVNGEVVIDGGDHTGALPGRVLRR